MDKTVSALVTITTAIIGVAILAVLVSRQANTAGVIKEGGNSFANALRVALSPVVGGGGGGGQMYGYTPMF